MRNISKILNYSDITLNHRLYNSYYLSANYSLGISIRNQINDNLKGLYDKETYNSLCHSLIGDMERYNAFI